MADSSTVQRAEAYLNLHLTRKGPLGAPAVGPYVTISHESGTNSEELAESVRERLQHDDRTHAWEVYSGNLIEEMLRTNHLPTAVARFLPEDRIHEVDASIGEWIGLHPNLWTLVQKTNEFMRQLASGGWAILLGRGATFATAGIPHGVHVRLVAPAEYRGQVVARRCSITPAEALAQNAVTDMARRRYVRSTFGADICEPAAYDVIVNVARVPLETITELIAHRVAAEAGSAARSP